MSPLLTMNILFDSIVIYHYRNLLRQILIISWLFWIYLYNLE